MGLFRNFGGKCATLYLTNYSLEKEKLLIKYPCFPKLRTPIKVKFPSQPCRLADIVVAYLPGVCGITPPYGKSYSFFKLFTLDAVRISTGKSFQGLTTRLEKNTKNCLRITKLHFSGTRRPSHALGVSIECCSLAKVKKSAIFVSVNPFDILKH